MRLHGDPVHTHRVRQEAEDARAVLKVIRWHPLKTRVQAVALRLPDNVMHTESRAHRPHHLPDQPGHAAALVAVVSVHGVGVPPEIPQNVRLLLCQLFLALLKVLTDDHLPRQT